MIKSSVFFLSLISVATGVFAEQAATVNNTDDTASVAVPSTAQERAADSARFQAGMLYYRDPETGQMAAMPPELARGIQMDALNFSDQGLTVREMPDGSRMIDLQGRYQMSSTVQTTQHGTVFQCSSHPHHHMATPHVQDDQSDRAVR